MSRVVLYALMLSFYIIPSYADEECRAVMASPLAIVKGMADYKAAMDAGTAACAGHYPEVFSSLQPLHDTMQDNMQQELDQALMVLDQMMMEVAQCQNYQDDFKQMAHRVIEGQYEKSYARRHRNMSKEGLVTTDQDSCFIVQDMIEKYHQYYNTHQKLHYVLYESSKKQRTAGKMIKRRDYKSFEKARDIVQSSLP